MQWRLLCLPSKKLTDLHTGSLLCKNRFASLFASMVSHSREEHKNRRSGTNCCGGSALCPPPIRRGAFLSVCGNHPAACGAREGRLPARTAGRVLLPAKPPGLWAAAKSTAPSGHSAICPSVRKETSSFSYGFPMRSFPLKFRALRARAAGRCVPIS